MGPAPGALSPTCGRAGTATPPFQPPPRTLGNNATRGHAGERGSRPLDRVMKGATAAEVQAVGEVISFGAVLPEEIVMSWLVDDGVSSRGHRQALLDPRYTRAGANCQPHLLNPVCVVDLVEPPGE